MPSKILISILAVLLLAESAYFLLNRHPINRFKQVDDDGYAAFDTATGQLCRTLLEKSYTKVLQYSPPVSKAPKTNSGDPILDMIQNGTSDAGASEKARVEFFEVFQLVRTFARR